MNNVQKYEYSQFFHFSNLLSLSRIPISFLLINFLSMGEWMWVWITAIVGMVTDWADGYFARKNNDVTELGKILDPLADKVGMAIIVTAMWWHGYLPTFLYCMIVGRDALILIAVVWFKRRYPQAAVPMSDIYGKVSVCFIALGVLLHLTPYDFGREWMIIAAVVVSLVRYGYRMIMMVINQRMAM